MIDSNGRTLVAALAGLALLACSDAGGSGSHEEQSRRVSLGAFGDVYRKAHYCEDGTTLLDDTPVPYVTVPIELSGPLPAPASLSYELTGDASRGLHYEVVPGFGSPLALPEGATAGSIRLALDPKGLAGARWFRERLCRVTLTGGPQLKLGETTEFHLWIRPLAAPPRLAFPTASASGGSAGNPHTILIEQSAASEERTTVHYRLGGTAVEGSDYTIRTGSESGVLSIPPGETSAWLALDIAPAADGTGRDIVVALDHEAHDRSDANLWTFTHDWSLSDDAPAYAAEPSDHVSGGGYLVHHAPDGARGLEIIAQRADVPKSAPDGHPLQGIVQTVHMSSEGWYIRESFENEFYCGGPTKLLPLPTSTRVSVYVETFVGPDEWRNTSFVKLNLRNRVKDLNHAVVFRRGETEDEVRQDWKGGTAWGEPVATPTGYWGLWRTFAVMGDVWGQDFGVLVEVVRGEPRTRLWHSHFADGETEFTNNEGDGVTEEPGEDRMNPILRFTYFSKGDASWDLTGGDVANRGKGLLAYWPMLEASEARLAGPPARFWERRRNFWEPRGDATMDVSATTAYTLTIE